MIIPLTSTYTDATLWSLTSSTTTFQFLFNLCFTELLQVGHTFLPKSRIVPTRLFTFVIVLNFVAVFYGWEQVKNWNVD